MSQLTNTTNYTTSNLFLVCENHQEGTIVWICFSVVSFVLGFPGALAILWDMLQRGRKGNQITPYDVFSINVTILDGVFLVFHLLKICNYRLWHNLELDELFNNLHSFNMCGRPLFITCICVDCYLAVVHPVVYRANKSLTPRILIAIAVWIVTFIYGFVRLGPVELASKLYLVLVLALTLPIISFCDATILWTLRRSNPAGGSIHPKKKKALQIITNNIVVTITSYFPPVIAMLISECLNLDRVTYFCLVLTPVFCSILTGNAIFPILHLNNLGKLDWLKSLCKK